MSIDMEKVEWLQLVVETQNKGVSGLGIDPTIRSCLYLRSGRNQLRHRAISEYICFILQQGVYMHTYI